MIPPWSAATADSVRRWTTDAIHDTVAAIARQAAYSTSAKRSLFGRFFRFVLDRLHDIGLLLGRSPGVRLIVIVAVALVLTVIAARIFVARRIEHDRSRRGSRAAGGRGRTDYWDRARALADSGDHVAASHALYLAVLDELARTGAVRAHPSKTSGDYAAELLRRGSPAAMGFLAFSRQFERIAFGTANAGEEFERLASAAKIVRPATEAA